MKLSVSRIGWMQLFRLLRSLQRCCLQGISGHTQEAGYHTKEAAKQAAREAYDR